MGELELARPITTLHADNAETPAGFTLKICSSIEEAASEWLAFEACALPSLYQRLDWLSPWQANVGVKLGHQPLIVSGYFHGRPAFLLPMALVPGRLSLNLEWLGAVNGNQNPGLWCPEEFGAIRPPLLAAALRQAAQATQADRVHLINVPRIFAGQPHPLASLPHRASVSEVHIGPLDQDYDQLLRARHDRDSRRKLDKKLKALARLGPVTLSEPETPEEIIALLDVFVAQRDARARTAGVPNVFSDPGLKAAVLAALLGSGGRSPVLQISALDVGGIPRATYVTGRSGSVLHGYANSIAGDESLPFSPGLVLLTMLIRRAAEDPGLTVLDLGLGDERYKHAWTDPEPLVNVDLAASTLGRLSLATAMAVCSVRRRLRASKLLWPLYRRLRRWL